MPMKKTWLLVELLREHPSGLTARDVADRLGADRRNIGSQLSKLAAYGITKSTRGRAASDTSLCAIYFVPVSSRPPDHSDFVAVRSTPLRNHNA